MAVATLTRLNPNPRNGEPLYGLGLALRHANRLDEADEVLARAAWSEGWRGPAQFARAQLAASQGQTEAALGLLSRVVDANPDQFAARSLRATLSRRMGRPAAAWADIRGVLAVDPLDAIALDQRRRLEAEGWAGDGAVPVGPLVDRPLPGGVQTALDVAHDYAAAGLLDEAVDVLRRLLPVDGSGEVHPMVRYTLAWLLQREANAEATAEFSRAAEMPPDYCFPARLAEIDVLEAATTVGNKDARARYYLGNLLYDRRRYEDAIAMWRHAAELDPGFPTAHRNLGLAEFNVLGRPDEALVCYRRAFAAGPSDARVLYELDYLRRRCGEPPEDRARLLEAHRALVGQRDDLTVEYVTLLNLLGRHREALAVLAARRFHPWEGGEGLVSGQWVLTNLRLGQLALDASDTGNAVRHCEMALERPRNLGEARYPLAAENEAQFHLGLALRAAGRETEAQTWLASAAREQGDPQAPLGEPAYWQAQAHRAFEREAAADAVLRGLLTSARERARKPQKIDYFATSLPTFLVFNDDLDRRNRVECRYLEALALAGLGSREEAANAYREVLDLDAAHAGAAWHLRML